SFYPALAAPQASPLSLHDALPICRGADVEAHAPARVDAKMVERRRKLCSAARYPRVLGARAQIGIDGDFVGCSVDQRRIGSDERSEEHTSELQSRGHLVCRLLLEK